MTENQAEQETMTAILSGVKQESKRTVYEFENANNPERPLRFSAFEPNLPSLKIGKEYTFRVAHVPIGDGKFYHNLARKGGKDTPYAIQEAKPEYFDKSDKGPIPSASATPAQRPKSSQDIYWENKGKMEERREARDIARDPKIVRESCLSTAGGIIAAKTNGNETDAQTEERTIKMAASFADWCETGKIPVFVKEPKK